MIRWRVQKNSRLRPLCQCYYSLYYSERRGHVTWSVLNLLTHVKRVSIVSSVLLLQCFSVVTVVTWCCHSDDSLAV